MQSRGYRKKQPDTCLRKIMNSLLKLSNTNVEISPPVLPSNRLPGKASDGSQATIAPAYTESEAQVVNADCPLVNALNRPASEKYRCLDLKSTSDTFQEKAAANTKHIFITPTHMRYSRMRKGISHGVQIANAQYARRDAVYDQWLITLTYRDKYGWQARNISQFNKLLRSWASRRGIRIIGFWVMELQQRGAPHYHILLFIPTEYTPPRPDYNRRWVHGYSRQRRVTDGMPYLLKSVSKIRSGRHAMPRNARLFGIFGLNADGRNRLRHARLPEWLQTLAEVDDRIVRQGDGFWVNWTKGAVYRSPWRFVGVRPSGNLHFERHSDAPQIRTLSLLSRNSKILRSADPDVMNTECGARVLPRFRERSKETHGLLGF